jgi:lysophospholipase L1-like esterase
MKKQINIIFLSFLTLALLTASTQPFGWEEQAAPPPTKDLDFMEVPDFVNEEANYIHYPEQLAPFWDKLQALKNGQRDRLHILHIGDSHLQAGYITGELRKFFQHQFGNAGRGLVFPYQLAKTNAPSDIRSSSDVQWVCERNIDREHEVPVGVCGYSLRTYSPNFEMDLQLKNEADFFDKVTIFGSNGKDAFDLQLQTAGELGPLNTTQQSFKAGTCFMLNQPQTSLKIKGKKGNNNQRQFTLQGVLLENSKRAGVLYSSIGVNGATYKAYNQSADFIPQVSALQPDIIIISLGTNESANSQMNTSYVQQQVEELLNNIKKYTNCKAVLLVTPPDIYIRGRYPTKNGQKLAEMMHDLSKTHPGLAIWDFYEVMGGYGSINKWVYAKLARNDRVHYSADGYRLQGQLLYKAMMKYFDSKK